MQWIPPRPPRRKGFYRIPFHGPAVSHTEPDLSHIHTDSQLNAPRRPLPPASSSQSGCASDGASLHREPPPFGAAGTKPGLFLYVSCVTLSFFFFFLSLFLSASNVCTFAISARWGPLGFPDKSH